MNFIENADFLKGTSLEGKPIYYKGDLQLLNSPRVSIVGSRRPNGYAKTYTHEIASKLAKAGVCVVSGGAIGVDAIAHKAATPARTIMVAATGLDVRYPAINKHLIAQIEQEGLVLSQFEMGTPSLSYHFPLRNELIVALGEVLVVTYADLKSGSMRSIEYAKKLGKRIYVLPHRLGESEGTNRLLRNAEAEAIYDIDAFVALFATTNSSSSKSDPLLEFCAMHPTYDEAIAKFGAQIFEYELAGKIEIKDGKVFSL